MLVKCAQYPRKKKEVAHSAPQSIKPSIAMDGEAASATARGSVSMPIPTRDFVTFATDTQKDEDSVDSHGGHAPFSAFSASILL